MSSVRVAAVVTLAALIEYGALAPAFAQTPIVVAAATEADPATPGQPPRNPLAAAIAVTTPSAVPTPPAPPAVTLNVKIDLAAQTATIIAHGETIHTWKISSGTAEFATPRGLFQPQWMAKMWYSKKYDDAPMPHAVFFNGGVAMHATQAVHALGRPASHGCVRLAPANAATFYALVQKHGQKQTRIHVFGTPNFAPKVAQKSSHPSVRQSQFATHSRPGYPTQPLAYYPQPQKQTYLLDGLFGGSPAPQPVYRPNSQQARAR